MTTTVGVIAAILCTGAIMAVVLLALLKVGSRQDGPDYGLALFREDSTPDEDDPMDVYLEERAAGNGVLPAMVEAPAKIHPQCYDAYYDHQPLDTYACCAAALAGAPR